VSGANALCAQYQFLSERRGGRARRFSSLPSLPARDRPFCPAWKGTRTTVERALNLIANGALDNGNVAALAAKLGVGPRHLSRLFSDHLDASPLQIALSLRIQRAKRLLDGTDLSVGQIAARAGFSHPRRMRAAFLTLYGQPPFSFRKRRRRSD
jgi:AraC family transcriptional regulator, regulatory protein of adaptative response / methylated-DNA-[protein]-cysteine methyltransferase